MSFSLHCSNEPVVDSCIENQIENQLIRPLVALSLLNNCYTGPGSSAIPLYFDTVDVNNQGFDVLTGATGPYSQVQVLENGTYKVSMSVVCGANTGPAFLYAAFNLNSSSTGWAVGGSTVTAPDLPIICSGSKIMKMSSGDIIQPFVGSNLTDQYMITYCSEILPGVFTTNFSVERLL
jgi:hypothetical protein